MSSGLLLVGHGTRDNVGTEEFFELARRLATHVSPVPVEPALLEFQEPTIQQAWDRLVDAGVGHIHVAPLLLFAAGHAKQDIPDVVRACHESTPHVGWSQSRPLSRHPALIQLAVDKAHRALESHRVESGTVAYVVVGRGSHDPCAQADTRVLSSILGHHLGVASCATAFYAMAQPNVPTVLDQVAERDGVTTILVQPHLLFAGRLYDAICNQVNEARLRHPNIRFLVTEYLGPDPMVARSLADRVFGSSTLYSTPH